MVELWNGLFLETGVRWWCLGGRPPSLLSPSPEAPGAPWRRECVWGDQDGLHGNSAGSVPRAVGIYSDGVGGIPLGLRGDRGTFLFFSCCCCT